MVTVIPVLRAFDYAKLKEFYVDWLGFTINWEHKPDNAPFYLQVSLRGGLIELSEHHGDCSPGAKVFFRNFEGLEAFHASLRAKNYTYNRPGLERVEWSPNTLEMTVIDPFHNQVIFNEEV
ncbi:MAG: VOC family protein [Filimonas sp.]|nr:VOC family protein [Filimonas sp.]